MWNNDLRCSGQTYPLCKAAEVDSGVRGGREYRVVVGVVQPGVVVRRVDTVPERRTSHQEKEAGHPERWDFRKVHPPQLRYVVKSRLTLEPGVRGGVLWEHCGCLGHAG